MEFTCRTFAEFQRVLLALSLHVLPQTQRAKPMRRQPAVTCNQLYLVMKVMKAGKRTYDASAFYDQVTRSIQRICCQSTAYLLCATVRNCAF